MSEDIFVQHGKAGTPLDGVFVMDAHSHLGSFQQYRFLDASVEGMIRAMDLLGIDVSAPSAIPACTDGLIVAGNDLVIDAVQRYPERILGYISVNPRYPAEAAAELRRGLAAGLRAVKVHTSLGTPYHDPSYTPVWEFADEHKLPLLAHTWGNEQLRNLEPHFAAYPNVKWILGHSICGADLGEYLRLGNTYPNVYLDTVFSGCTRGTVESFVAQGVEDKLLFGSDCVFLATEPQLGRILFAKITPEQKTKILGGNARKVFGV